jgi:hypothetical protein
MGSVVKILDLKLVLICPRDFPIGYRRTKGLG